MMVHCTCEGFYDDDSEVTELIHEIGEPIKRQGYAVTLRTLEGF